MISKNTYRLLFVCAIAACCSCHNEDTQRPPEPAKDSTAVAQGGAGSNDSTKRIDSTAAIAAAKNNSAASSTKQPATSTPTTTEKTKAKQTIAATKKQSLNTDSSAKTAAVTKNNSATTDNAKTATSGDNTADKPFVSKYGIIPRDATESNVTSFNNAFPDKQILVKINFNSDPDAEMQKVKAQIIKVLKKLGYSNVSDQSQTFHPMRIPKDVHYELQHDGSVVIWLPPVTSE